MWNPPITLSPEEQKIAARTQKARKFRDYSKDTGLLQAARASCKVWRVW